MKEKKDYLHSSPAVKASMVIMGLGQLMQRQWMKGCLYLAVFVGFIVYMVQVGA